MGTEPKGKLVCPGCLREVGFKDYVQQAAFMPDPFASISNFIDCQQCGYYGLPVEITPEKKKSVTGKK